MIPPSRRRQRDEDPRASGSVRIRVRTSSDHNGSLSSGRSPRLVSNILLTLDIFTEPNRRRSARQSNERTGRHRAGRESPSVGVARIYQSTRAYKVKPYSGDMQFFFEHFCFDCEETSNLVSRRSHPYVRTTLGRRGAASSVIQR